VSATVDQLPPRMRAKIHISGECWLWTGAVTSSGYGSFAYQGRTQSTHRLAYELLVGPIPDGLTIDHLAEPCGNKLCCNPVHMEPVTRLENYRRWRRDVWPRQVHAELERQARINARLESRPYEPRAVAS
jgi:hypothetical protein